MNPGELERLVTLIASRSPETVIEFGVNEGRTAKALLDHVLDIQHYVGIDVLPGYVTAKAAQRKEIPSEPGRFAVADPRFRLILRERGSLDLLADDLPACDVAFIDGDHSWRGVLHDSMLARSLVRHREGMAGLIIWHDYHDLGSVDVRDVLEVFAANGHDIRHVEETWLAFEMR